MKYNEKMSELLGILNSINFDEVINQMEIDALKNWIETNSNNKDPRYQEIINKLNKILEDNVITEEEKKEIVDITNNFYNLGSTVDNMSELVGIVEGILSDNEVNQKEVEHLLLWLNKNTKLKGNFFYDKLVVVVNLVLQDNVLDDNEKNELKVLLTFLLKDNRLNQRIDVLKEQVKNNEIIGNKLIELIDDNTIISKIHKEAMKQLNELVKTHCSIYAIDCEIIFISLTLIALLNYDSNYYDYVAETYEELYDKYSEQRIEGQIRNVINKYKNDDDTRIISLVLKNAIVPKHFLPSFFEFIYDIYRLNFNFSIDPNSDLADEFSFVYDGIKKGMNYEDDVLNLKVTNKTYSLIKTTKDLITDDEKIKSLIDLSVSILKIIDSYYWSNTIEFENEYFKYGFENWRAKMDKSIQETKRENNGLHSRWEPEFKLNENKIYLSIPNHKIKTYYDYEKLKINIFNNDELLYENTRLNVYDIIGGYRIENDDVLINNPLGNLRYVLSCDEEIIYDSKERLYRDFIFFNGSGNELKNNRDYEGIAILCSDTEVENLQKMYSSEKYILSYKNVKTGEYLKVNETMFNFSTILSPGVIGIENKCIFNSNNIDKLIYTGVEGIVYESEKKDSNVVININGVRNKLSDLNCDKKQRGLYNNYFIKLDLENNEYDISIEELEDNDYVVKKKFNFVLDSEFNYNLEQTNSEEYLISINLLNKKYNKSINFDIDDINKIEFEEQNIFIIVPLNLQLYKIDTKKWNSISDLNNYIWIDDISSYCNLRINGFDFTSAKVMDEEGNLLTTLYPSTEKFYSDLSIGSLKSYENHNYIYIDFYNESRKIGLIKVYCKCTINMNLTKFYYDKDDNKYHGKISYFGRGNILVKVTNEFDNVIFESNVANGDEIEIDSIESFVNYKLQIVEKKFGFTLQKDNVLYETNIKYYSMQDFVGKYFQVYLANYDQVIMGKFTRKSRLLYNTYVEIIEQVDDYQFIGNLYVHKGEKKYFDKLNPVEIEFTSDINDGQVEAIITKDEDGLFNDFENHTILNDLDSRTAIDIYSYVINMERKR